eukprot:6899745-Pyramimonas_sp.AAC.1
MSHPADFFLAPTQAEPRFIMLVTQRVVIIMLLVTYSWMVLAFGPSCGSCRALGGHMFLYPILGRNWAMSTPPLLFPSLRLRRQVSLLRARQPAIVP